MMNDPMDLLESQTEKRQHPPLNTPLSAFTPEMLDALPVGSAFGEGEDSLIGDVEKRADGWASSFGWLADDFGDDEWDGTRPLIRVGPEQACEPAPLPDPWPGVQVEYVNAAGFIVRGVVSSWWTVEESPGAGCFRIRGEASETFHPAWDVDTIREVRTPDGVTVWKRAAAKVTTGPRALSTYTPDEIRAFPVGTSIDDPNAPTEEARGIRFCLLTDDGWTHGKWYHGPKLTMAEFIAWEVPRQPAALVHFPAKVTT